MKFISHWLGFELRSLHSTDAATAPGAGWVVKFGQSSSIHCACSSEAADEVSSSGRVKTWFGRITSWYSITLSWHCSNQSLPCPANPRCQARKRQVSMLYIIGLIQPGTELPISHMGGMRFADSATAPGWVWVLVLVLACGCVGVGVSVGGLMCIRNTGRRARILVSLFILRVFTMNYDTLRVICK